MFELIILFLVAKFAIKVFRSVYNFFSSNSSPKINFSRLSSDFKDHMNNLDSDTYNDFIHSLSFQQQQQLQAFMDSNNQQQMTQMMQDMMDQQVISDYNQFIDQHNFAMDDAVKSVTPFDHGGYVQGAYFNPSDTAAHDHQIDSMNQHSDFNTNHDFGSSHIDFGGGGGFGF